MDIKIDKDAVSAVVSTAIMNSMSETDRKILIQNAVENLLEKSAYGESRLQDAWNSAMRSVAVEQCQKYLVEDGDIHSKIKVMIADAWVKVMAKRDTVVDRIADSIVQAMQCHRD